MTGGVWALVLAGGSGNRYGGLKQFELLADRRVLDWSLDAARAACDGVVVVVPAGTIEDDSTGFGPYVFEWGEGKVALALGFGSLYNHSYRPNARYNDVGPQTKAFKALREIAPGEEVTVN